jgi:hypothetical protein
VFAIKNSKMDNLKEDFWRIIFLIIVVLLILFIGYSFDNNMRQTENLAGKAIELLFKHEQKENRVQQKISESEQFCEESDVIHSLNTGFNPYERGYIKYNNRDSLNKKSNDSNLVIIKTDHCVNKRKLIEYSCDNYLKQGQELFSTIICEFGCNEQFGKCNNNMQ